VPKRTAVADLEVRSGGAAPSTQHATCRVRAEAEDERGFVSALRARDESAFVALIDRYHAMMVRLARLFVTDAAIAEDVVQETWMGVLRGLDRFEARSSLKRWISTIVINRAKGLAAREGRSIPFSVLWDDRDEEAFEPAVASERFRSADGAWPGGWVLFPRDWDPMPDERLVSQETNRHILACIDGLPDAQRKVLVLRDVQGWSADDTCQLLQISEANQRVLLHRGRSKLRRALELYLTDS
jgi:RNA polymerase sigma-70 factor, ECF subfamily